MSSKTFVAVLFPDPEIPGGVRKDWIYLDKYVEQKYHGKITLVLGKDHWPFPIPLVKTTNGWQFDTQAGLEELLNRRIGGNELRALQSVRAYVAAQREYAETRDFERKRAEKMRGTPPGAPMYSSVTPSGFTSPLISG